eukprot:7160235-Pyramimonas_sp.AAC.1
MVARAAWRGDAGYFLRGSFFCSRQRRTFWASTESASGRATRRPSIHGQTAFSVDVLHILVDYWRRDRVGSSSRCAKRTALERAAARSPSGPD